jgi:hypothetical protein
MERSSNFKFDLKLGKLAEDKLSEIFSDKKIEVKRDFMAQKTGNVFIEYSSRGKASGISTTEAEYYCIVISDSRYILVSTKELKEKCRKYLNTKNDRLGGDNDTSKGIALPLIDLIK